ncbi:type VI secretion system lipoprotein TssJ [Pseudoduganella albidiflava]|uniref:Type VI secretion system lipoprotein TssJ n=1 Tax=Pseudoduganella albidiflava TaxID=321983 RepID=A0A411WWZ0_9BURK|nr:type VI secretion system lipoprotein TssJ [Pseudoduganella albidiflava]QBI01301.1 type VI secretion system lipoprotein TssJ [Pseudoduganella albidiflava]GGY36746.1 hypothetical protein GCM10007387_18860 [Pseudoduganella albidiflava]
MARHPHLPTAAPGAPPGRRRDSQRGSLFNSLTRALPAFSAALLAVLLSACAGAPKAEPPAPPTVIQATIAVAADANPDAGGRASPVVVRLFELKTLAAFEKADFFSLFEKGRETLGADLLADEEFVLQPGESRRFERRLQDGALHVAVVAGFRDLDRSAWRGSIAVRARATTPVAIGVQQRRITISDK